VLSCLPSGTRAAEAPARPNFVVLLLDDLRWDDLGCAGHPFVKTPRIDRVAKEGAMFRNAFATTPLCSPSRACFLTGQYAHTHGITDNTDRSARSHQLVTFPHRLQKAGYETAFIGKWHMGIDDAPRPGFDHWISVKGQGAYLDPELNENGKRVQVKGYATDIYNERALAFLKRPHKKPFLLYLAYKAVHPSLTQGPDGKVSDPSAAAFLPAERHKKLYADAPVPRRPNVKDTLEGKPALQRKIGDLPPLSEKTGTSDEVIRDRLRMLMAVEEGVGDIFKALDDAKLLDDTLIVFTSDHGYFYGEHGLSVERRLAYEETIRIPLLMRYPRRIKAGTTVDPFALSVDLAPTLLELADVEVPQDMQGRSLLPLLKGDEAGWRTSFLIEYFSDTVFPRVHKMGYQAVRTERWKYIHYGELERMDELYDLKADPYEMKNLIEEPGAQDALKEIKAELARRLKEKSQARGK
jgi:N-acetylglucosamine-6-sulfatase